MMTGLPTDLQLDALREVANIGVGNAATALSRLVGGRTVCIDVPRVHAASTDAQTLAGGLGRVVAVALDIVGQVSGKMLLMWSEADARELARLLLGAQDRGSLWEEPRKSALSEAANIVASACLSAVGSLTGLRMMPTPPHLVVDDAKDVIADALQDGRLGEAAVVLEARLHADHTPTLVGQMLVVPERHGLARLFSALGL